VELTRLLKGKSVFLDTAPIIYFIEKNSRYLDIVRPVMTMIDSGETTGYSSTISLLEVLVQPLRNGNRKLAQQYRSILLSSKGLTTCEISHAISEKAAQLRATHTLRTPDALQLASAIILSSNFFLTNDSALKSVKEIKVIVLDDYR
jgi:predicted nucleic acid-binding protein